MGKPYLKAGVARYLLVASVATFAFPVLFVGQDRSFDLQYHLFLAEHYRGAWFSGWERGWYEGFFVYCYPPLSHQLLALASEIMGLDAAGRVLGVVLVGSLPVALGRLARLLGGPQAQLGVAIVIPAWTAPFVFLLVWGQVAALLALVFAVLAVGSLLSYLREGRSDDCALWVLLAASCAASHHQTSFFLLPLLTCATVLTAAPSASQLRGTSILRRTAVALGLAATASLLVLLPHLWWLTTQAVPQTPIPHPSRSNFFGDPVMARLFFFCLWGAMIVVLPVAAASRVRRQRLGPWSAAAGLCTLLGFGTLTPLPRLLFRGWSEWLTYERFTLWGSALAVLIAGCWLRQPRRTSSLVLMFCCSGVAGLAILTAWILPNLRVRSSDPVVSSLTTFLDTDDNAEWRYLTLGLGANRVSRLSRLSHGRSVDGFYFMARRDPELSRSGVGLVDEAFSFRNGLHVLNRYLFDPDSAKLRWIFSADARASARLSDAGWRLIKVVPQSECNADMLWKCVEIWEAPAGRRISRAADASSRMPPVPLGFGILWGLAPASAFLLALLVALRRVIGCQRSASLDNELQHGPHRQAEDTAERCSTQRSLEERHPHFDD